jgi:hypothetical protein
LEYDKYRKSNYRYESGISFFKYFFKTGYYGEALTFMELEKLNHYGKIMTNLYIPTENGTAEIDLLYISSNGIYVIESKNLKGWIYGNENHKYWTTVIYRNKVKFFNPIWQNNKHIKYLRKIVNVPLHSVIVFSNRCSLKIIHYDNSLTKIVKRKYLVKYLERQLNKNPISTNEPIDETYNLLNKYKLKSKAEKQKHIDQIKKII